MNVVYTCFNRDSLHTATDPFDLYPHLEVKNDTGHAFYLGVEMARAQIAWQLGKQYTQDSELDWGCAVERKPEDLNDQQQVWIDHATNSQESARKIIDHAIYS